MRFKPHLQFCNDVLLLQYLSVASWRLCHTDDKPERGNGAWCERTGNLQCREHRYQGQTPSVRHIQYKTTTARWTWSTIWPKRETVNLFTCKTLPRSSDRWKKKTPWSESASELYRPSDHRLSAKWLPTFADRGCHVVSVKDSYGRILGFLDRSRYFSIK
jgi:hypothetical protein